MSEPLDAEDAARVRLAENRALRLTMMAIFGVNRYFWGTDRHFIDWVCPMAPEHLSDKQRDHVQRVAWRLRRHLPEHLRPRVNPDDPIVRDMRNTVHG
jgi:hypothetical protein